MTIDRSTLAGGLLGVAVLALLVVVGLFLWPAAELEEAQPAPLPLPSPEAPVLTTVEPAPLPAPAPQPAPTPAPTPENPELADGPVHLRRLIVAPGVEGREPVRPSDRVPVTPRVYAFMEAVNRTAEDATLEVTFEPVEDGESTGHVELRVPAESRRWRTWAFTRNLRPGRWEAVVREGERVVGRRAFTVTP
jgi:hypothetical protein